MEKSIKPRYRAKKVKDSGLISKALAAASGVASALEKQGFADKLGTAQRFAESVGAVRRQKRKSAAPKKLRSYAARGLQCEQKCHK